MAMPLEAISGLVFTHTCKLSTSSEFNQKLNTVRNSPSVPELWCPSVGRDGQAEDIMAIAEALNTLFLTKISDA